MNIKTFVKFLFLGYMGHANAYGTETPRDGKFFYAQLNNEFNTANSGMNYFNVKVGNGQGEITQKMYISSQESIIATMTDTCENCDVPNKYNKAASSTYNPNVGRSGEQHHGSSIFNENNRERLVETIFSGEDFQDEFRFELPQYNRETKVNLTALGITKSTSKFKSDESGFFGLRPTTTDSDGIQFMAQLKKAKIISYEIVAISAYMTGTSMVKFGGYDDFGMSDPTRLVKFKTTDQTKNYQLEMTDWRQNGHTLVGGGTIRPFYIDPQFPYVYIPNQDYTNFASQATQVFGSDITCGNTVHAYCKFPKMTCDKVPNKNFNINFVLSDRTRKVTYQIMQDRFMIPGHWLGDTDQTCYFAVFNDFSNDLAWFVGNAFLKDHYVYFDATPSTVHGQNYFQIGIGPIRTPLVIGDCQYSSIHPKDCKPDPKSQDTSASTTNTPNSGGNASNDPSDPEGEGMSIGVIIVIILLVLATIGAVVFYVLRKKKAASAAGGDHVYSNVTLPQTEKTTLN